MLEIAKFCLKKGECTQCEFQDKHAMLTCRELFKYLFRTARMLEEQKKEYDRLKEQHDILVEKADEMYSMLKERETVAHALEVLRVHGWREGGYMDVPGEPGIVRCKDCKYKYEEFDGDWQCARMSGFFRVMPDWFCADGEAKE